MFYKGGGRDRVGLAGGRTGCVCMWGGGGGGGETDRHRQTDRDRHRESCNQNLLFFNCFAGDCS